MNPSHLDYLSTQEIADRNQDNPLVMYLCNRLIERDAQADDKAKALTAARELEEAARALIEDHEDGTAAMFLQALTDRLTTLEKACEAFKDLDPGE